MIKCCSGSLQYEIALSSSILIEELEQQCSIFRAQGKSKEAKMLWERVEYDMQLIASTGSCKDMDN